MTILSKTTEAMFYVGFAFLVLLFAFWIRLSWSAMAQERNAGAGSIYTVFIVMGILAIIGLVAGFVYLMK